MTTNADEPGEDLNRTLPLPTGGPVDAAGPGDHSNATVPLPIGTPIGATAGTGAAASASAATPAEPWLATSVYAASPRPLPSGQAPVRWGGIVWGLLLILFAGTTLAVISSPARVVGVTAWMTTLTPGATVAVWIGALGLIIVVSALLGVIAAAQRGRRRS